MNIEQVGQDIKAIDKAISNYFEADTSCFVLTCAETNDDLGDALRTTFVVGLGHPS